MSFSNSQLHSIGESLPVDIVSDSNYCANVKHILEALFQIFLKVKGNYEVCTDITENRTGENFFH
jgi:hypothetical protein